MRRGMCENAKAMSVIKLLFFHPTSPPRCAGMAAAARVVVGRRPLETPARVTFVSLFLCLVHEKRMR